MFEHPVPWLLGVLTGIAATVVAALATRLRLLPEVIDLSVVPTAAGTVGLMFAA